jgi:type IV pilus assembly protein PilE
MQLKYKSKGFTLIELLITVAIIGVLASIAYPSYSDFVVRSNRTEAQRELLRIANLQEQLFVDSRAYTEDMKTLGLGSDPFKTESENYSIDAKVTGNTFILTATALGNQKTTDTGCVTLSVTDTGLKSPSGTCWE